jgi:hypothetical protein
MRMRTKLRLAALVLMLFVLGFWFACGHNTGFTKNQVLTTIPDPVTGLEGPVWVKKFVPGVDFLAVGFLLAGLQFGSSFFIRRDA